MSQDNVASKTAIVTGAGRGIGRAISLRLAELGANVVLAARSAQQLDQSRSAGKHAGKMIVCPTDVSDPAQVQRLIDFTRRECGPVDFLINNAGQVRIG